MSDYPMTRGKQQRPLILSVCRSRGFTLIELMVAMLLGLIVIGGVISVFLAGQQTYRANEALGDVQDGSRTSFEILTRDLRYAGYTGCDNGNGRVANALNNTTLWYTNWGVPLQGFDDATADPALTGITGAGAPIKGSSSVRVLSTTNTDVSVGSASGSPTSFNINAASTQLAAGDIIMLCDFDHATILQIASYGGTSVGFTNGTTLAPGNCSLGLGYPTICTSAGNAYTFLPNARVGVLTAVDWYVGTNPLGGQSLYRLSVTYSAAGASVTASTTQPAEIVRNVTGMQIKYLMSSGTTFTNAAGVGNWATVNAAQVTLTLQSGADTHVNVNNAGPITRTFTSTTAMRNRVP